MYIQTETNPATMQYLDHSSDPYASAWVTFRLPGECRVVEPVTSRAEAEQVYTCHMEAWEQRNPHCSLDMRVVAY